METKDAGKRLDEPPLFKQISGALFNEIQDRYKPGDILPPEIELAKRFDVNRHTIRRAIGELVTKGVVGKLQGKGTIVQQKIINYSINSGTRFTETLESCGRQPESIVLKKIGIPADKEVASLLQLKTGNPVILVETLRKMDGAPFSVVSHYFPFEKVYEVMRSYNGGSLHTFLFETYNLKLKRTLSLISAELPDPEDIEILEITGNFPLLRVKSINVSEDTNEPIELAVSRFKALSTQLSVKPS